MEVHQPLNRGRRQIILGAANNQFILPSSAEVGFTSELVPEPGSTAVALLGGAGLAVAAARSRRRSGATAGRIRRSGSVTVDAAGPTS
jgi:MYXO-CTERM domain-containing protein